MKKFDLHGEVRSLRLGCGQSLWPIRGYSNPITSGAIEKRGYAELLGKFKYRLPLRALLRESLCNVSVRLTKSIMYLADKLLRDAAPAAEIKIDWIKCVSEKTGGC